ncbi:hypothetical protein FACS189442_6510 [Spirochaetia bacterium]|nr:hypothetical protein FACS189442_6510 [Spirochaetia bacterium]
MKDRIKIKGMVTVRVLDKDGNVKRHKPRLLRSLLRLPGKPMIQKWHNIVTREGDALIADALPCLSDKNEGNKFFRVHSGGYWLDRKQHKNQYPVQCRNWFYETA